MPKWIGVTSSNLQAVAYERGNLYIRFNTGAMYVYYDVPIEVAQALLDAESKGQFLHNEIKGVYDYSRLTT